MRFETLNEATSPSGVLSVTLNRPDKRNALSAQMIAELTALAQGLDKRPDVRVVVLRGAGAMFCAGGDLAWMKAQIEADRATRMAEARKIAHMLRALNEMPKPLISLIHGAAMGGGVGLACVSDYVIAETTAKFGLTETRLGLIPATIGPYVIARMGEGMARQVFMSSAIFSAEKAQTYQIVSEITPEGGMEAALDRQVSAYLKTAPMAVATAKKLARRLGPVIDEAVIEATIQTLADVWEGPEALAGIEAFFAKKPAPWVEKPRALK